MLFRKSIIGATKEEIPELIYELHGRLAQIAMLCVMATTMFFAFGQPDTYQVASAVLFGAGTTYEVILIRRQIRSLEVLRGEKGTP
jgi:hypothetical protein